MKSSRGARLAAKFARLDLHDDNLTSITIDPPHKKTGTATIHIELSHDGTGARKLLSFRRCANLRMNMDFDVLADNWFAQTKGALASSKSNQLRKFVQGQRRHWGTEYMPPSPSNKPTRKKLASLKSYSLFRVRFFGGTIEVLAKEFSFTGSKILRRAARKSVK
jgi:hypothetical protein